MTGYMAREFFAMSPVLWLPVVALVIFATLFVVLSVRALRMRDADERAHLVLEDGKKVPRG